MSRVANNPVELPSGVEVTLADSEISVKGAKEHWRWPSILKLKLLRAKTF